MGYLLSLSVITLIGLVFVVRCQDGFAHMEGSNIDPLGFKPLTDKEIRESEKKPGMTPVIPQTNALVPKKHPNIPGTPGSSPAMGPNDAPVKVHIWSDFQCPNCMRAVEPLKHLVRKYPKDVQVIFKHFPLPSHTKAYKAALAAAAAARQGKFWEYQDILFQNMRQLHEADLKNYAKNIGLDMIQFNKDFDDQSLKDQIEYETKFGSALGITGTPGFSVNGKIQSGWGSYNGIESFVKMALGKDKKCNIEGYDC